MLRDGVSGADGEWFPGTGSGTGRGDGAPEVAGPATEPTAEPGAAGDGSEEGTGHPVLAGLALVRAGLALLKTANAWSLSDAELTGAIGDVVTRERELAGVRLALTAELERRPELIGAAASTGAWLREAFRIAPGEAAASVRLARALDRELAATKNALAEGAISAEHARVIERAIAKLPRTDPDLRKEAEAFLLEQAHLFNPRDLARLAQHLQHVVDPELGDKLAKAEEQAARSRELYLSEPDARGMVHGNFRVDAETGEGLRTLLDPLAAPRPSEDGGRDPRSPAQRRGDAFAELIKLALDADLLPAHGKARPHVVITLDLDTLRKEEGAPGAEMAHGAVISAEAARRWACDARIIPIVLNSEGAPLDVGRANRSWPEPIRRAIVARDRGCSFPGCDRPPSWCDVHHMKHWADGGPTSVDNGALLCEHHHHLVHSQGWTVRLGNNRHPEFIPPKWPRQHRNTTTPNWRQTLRDLRRKFRPDREEGAEP